MPRLRAGAIRFGGEPTREADRHGFDGIEVNLHCLTGPGGERLLEGLDQDRTTLRSDYFQFSPGASNLLTTSW